MGSDSSQPGPSFQLPRQSIPEPLHDLLQAFETRLAALDSLPESLAGRLDDEQNAAQLARLISLSDFCAEQILRHPQELDHWLASGELQQASTKEQLHQRLQARLQACETLDAAALAMVLRRYRNAEMLRLIWRDQNRLCSMHSLTTELSYLADVCLQQALDFHYQQLCDEWGQPLDEQGRPIQMVVLGMGKLGAHELNLSSDIDLIFSYSEAGEIEQNGKRRSHQEFFLNLGQRLIKAIDERTADGFVFRVDMRLRPYGDSGSLALCFAAMEQYYQSQGRDWERYAMIKARVVAGDQQAGAELTDMLQPFVYRRYIDFSVIESLRSMKAMIVREVQRRGLQNNIKLGAGGIREVEFIAQVFQLVHGGRDKNLQHRELQKVLPVLAERQLMPQQAVAELLEAYEFLRNAEHALQAQNDQQTQSLPDSDYPQLRIASACGFDTWDAFTDKLDAYRSTVRGHFSGVIEAEDKSEGSDEAEDSLWSDLEIDADGDAGAERETDPFLQALIEFKQSSRVRSLQTIARERLDKVMPLLIRELQADEVPLLAEQRCLAVIDAILRRSAYLVLLHENPLALKHLVHLCANSAYIAGMLVQHPLLLDELIDSSTLYQAPDRDEVRSSLQQHMLRIHPDDTEAQMEQMRYFKRSNSLRVAAAEVSGALPLMKVSDYLSYIAEALLAYVLDLGWNDISTKFGNLPGASAEQKRFLILAYGKLGGLELSHGSDLDLVFIYDAEPNAMSDGDISVDSATWYTRLGQRIIHLLSTRTALGQVYEIDMRLRPSGNSGLLVSSIKGFGEYQNKKAWTWEHQALVRARAVAGDSELYDWFERTRLDILAAQREPAELRAQVVEMREKMREHLAQGLEEGQFHLKHSPGGIVDIEFVVQYAALMHCAAEPRVCEFTDNIRILDALEQHGFMPPQHAEQLRSAYIGYRACLHQLSLQDQDAIVSSEQFASEIQAVTSVWKTLLEE